MLLNCSATFNQMLVFSYWYLCWRLKCFNHLRGGVIPRGFSDMSPEVITVVVIIYVCLWTQTTDSMDKMYQPVWQLVRQQRNANTGPTKFSASPTEHRAAVEHSCFSLDLSESRNRPTNKEICGTERGPRGGWSGTLTHKHAQSPESARNSRKKHLQKSHNCCSIYFYKSLWAWHHLSLFRQSRRLLSQGGCLTCSTSLFLTLLKNLLGTVFIQECLKYWTPTSAVEKMHCGTVLCSVTLIKCIQQQCGAE